MPTDGIQLRLEELPGPSCRCVVMGQKYLKMTSV